MLKRKLTSCALGVAILGTFMSGCGGGTAVVGPYMYFVGENQDIFRVPLAGGAPELIQNETSTITFLKLSPDGTKLLYGTANLHVVNIDGTGHQEFTTYKWGDWNVDGTKIFGLTHTSRLRSMNPDGTGESADLFDGSGGGGSRDLDVNDAGNKIVMCTTVDGWFRISTINMDGTGWTQITAQGNADSRPNWSHDGTKIAFTRQSGGQKDIFVMNPDGTGQVNVTNTAADDEEDPNFDSAGNVLYGLTTAADWSIRRVSQTGTNNVEVYNVPLEYEARPEVTD